MNLLQDCNLLKGPLKKTCAILGIAFEKPDVAKEASFSGLLLPAFQKAIKLP